MHYHPIVNDRLLMFRKLNWIQNIKVQMYEESWKRKHDPYTLFCMHEIVSWFEMLMFKEAMEESGELNYNLPVNLPLYFRCTYLFMKPMEQLFLYGTTLTLMFPRVLDAESANISDVRERDERIRMAHEDKPWFQFHGDLETICLNGKEGIHNFMENLSCKWKYRMYGYLLILKRLIWILRILYHMIRTSVRNNCT